MVFEITGGRLDPPPPLVKGVGTKRLEKERVKRLKIDNSLLPWEPIHEGVLG